MQGVTIAAAMAGDLRARPGSRQRSRAARSTPPTSWLRLVAKTVALADARAGGAGVVEFGMRPPRSRGPGFPYAHGLGTVCREPASLDGVDACLEAAPGFEEVHEVRCDTTGRAG